MSKKPIVLGYWDFRGFGEACRYMLEYCGCDYKDKQYERKSKSDYSAWRCIRDDFGLDFPNLPYLIDGDRKLTESIAILKYLGRKNGLVPVEEDDIIRGDIAEGVILDLRTKFYATFFPAETYRTSAMEYKETCLSRALEQTVRFIGERKWLINDQLTYIDFMLYERLAQTTSLFPKCLDRYERLQKYMGDFEALPAISRYQKSGRFIRYPDHDPYIRPEHKFEE